MELQPQFSEAEIRREVRRLAGEISAAYRGESPVLVGVLKGSFVFLADLIRELTVPFEIDFVRARSYGSRTVSSGHVQITSDIEVDVRGRHVVVVEDIADTGLTLSTVVARIQAAAPASVKRCALLVRQGSPMPDFAGFVIGPGFVVGYGIDYAEKYRGLRDIRLLPPGSAC
ncbi:MAG TPA: hypoxanthine phosphoribosyltransferase [Candidatus Bathyarchaeia archaeon]|nr:hypoxanthine phosphoribosyltransferase [Candidatus Bathyarchaeia archaeon]